MSNQIDIDTSKITNDGNATSQNIASHITNIYHIGQVNSAENTNNEKKTTTVVGDIDSNYRKLKQMVCDKNSDREEITWRCHIECANKMYRNIWRLLELSVINDNHKSSNILISVLNTINYNHEVELLAILGLYRKDDILTQFLLKKNTKKTIEIFLNVDSTESNKHLLFNMIELSKYEEHKKILDNLKMDTTNFQQYLNLAQTLNYKSITDMINNFVEKKSHDIFKQELFLNMNAKSIKLILNSNNKKLSIVEKISVLQRWIDYDKCTRVSHADDLLQSMGELNNEVKEKYVVPIISRYSQIHQSTLNITTYRLKVIEDMTKKISGDIIESQQKSDNDIQTSVVIYGNSEKIQKTVKNTSKDNNDKQPKCDRDIEVSKVTFGNDNKILKLDKNIPKVIIESRQENDKDIPKNIYVDNGKIQKTKTNTFKDINENRRKPDNELQTSNENNMELMVIGQRGYRSDIDIDVYDNRNKKWMSFSNIKLKYTNFATTILDDDLILIGGFSGNNSYLKDVTSFNITSKTIIALPPLNIERSDTTANVIDGNIYVCGGVNEEEKLKSLEMWNRSNNEWKILSSMNNRTAFHFASTYKENLYVFERNNFGIEIYNPQRDFWSKTTIPKQIYGCESTVLNDQIYVFENNTKGVHIYDPNNKQWISGISLPKPINNPSVVTINGKIFVSGKRYVYEYDPCTDEWKEHSLLLNSYSEYHKLIAVSSKYIYEANNHK